MINLLNKTIALSATLLCTAVASANPITPKQAQELVKPFMTVEYSQPRLVKKAVRKSRAKLASRYETTAPYYIYSRGEGQGFVIVSGDDCLPEVLGYTESGDFDENDMPPFLTWYLDYYGSAVERAQAAGAGPYEAPKAAAGRVNVAPLIQTHWHQTAPYNDLCPTRKDGGGRCVTGCVATAASQVAYYWHKDLPHETQAATTSYTYGSEANATTAFPKGTPLKWELMRMQYSSEPAEYREAVATLLAVVGGGAGLTYGSSTAGYNDNCRSVYNNILGLYGGQENAKDWGEEYNNYSDDAWSTLLYNEVSNSRPVLYSGCNASGEGHAVVVDGYQASTGYFHFNLGWGNPSAYDGYFTVARGKSPSWGFNDSWQECVTGIRPKKQNLAASVELPLHSYLNVTNTLKVSVRNNGTLPYSGIYLFINTTGSKPTSTSSAKSKDTELVMPADSSECTIRLDYKPTSAKTNYIIITDNNLNILSKVELTPETSVSDLCLKEMFIDGSSDVEQAGGNDYTVVYGSKAIAYVYMTNRADCDYEGTLRMNISASEDGGNTFTPVGTKTAKFSIPANSTGFADVSISSTSSCPIEEGKLYVASFENPITSSSSSDEVAIPSGIINEVRFCLRPSSLEIDGYEDGCLRLNGMWDASQFTTIAKRSAYKAAESYDLTGVTGIKRISGAPFNENAMFYVADGCEAEGANVISGGVCKNLKLVPGVNFTIREDFFAEKASVTLNQQADRWYLLTPPCNLTVPVGMTARRITGHSSSGISNKAENVDTLYAGYTYMVMTSSTGNQVMTGSNTPVVKNVCANPDTAFVGTFVNTTTPEGAMLMDMEESQYYQPQETGTFVEAMRGYFIASNIKKAFRAYSSITLDPAYQLIGQAIENAYAVQKEYKELVSSETYQMMTDSIQKAEALFTARELETSDARKAATALNDFCEAFKMMLQTLGNKTVDYTSYIQNPSFEANAYSAKGWTYESQTLNLYKDTNLSHQAVGMDGTLLVESNVNGQGTLLNQTVSELVQGYYTLSAMVGSDSGNTITMFAGDSVTTVNAHTLGHFYLTEARLERVKVGEDGQLTIGIKAGDWYKVDDFQLMLTEMTVSTDIDEIDLPATSRNIDGTYDLTGRKVTPERVGSVKGLIIVNGKKVWMK